MDMLFSLKAKNQVIKNAGLNLFILLFIILFLFDSALYKFLNFISLIDISAILALIIFVFTKKYDVNAVSSKERNLIILFLVYTLFSILYGNNFFASENLHAIAYFVILLVFSKVTVDSVNYKNLTILNVLLITLTVIFCLFFSQREEGRIVICLWRELDPNFFSANIILLTTAAWSLVLRKKYAVINILVVVLSGIIVLLMGSRGGLVGNIAAIMACTLCKLKKEKIKLILIALAMLVALFIVFLFLPQEIKERFSLGSFVTGSGRWMIWRNYLQIFNNQSLLGKIFGLGKESGILLYVEYYNFSYETHCLYLKILIEQGIFGLSLFLLASMFLLIKLFRKECYFSFGILSGFLMVSVFLHLNSNRIFYIVFLICIINLNTVSLINKKRGCAWQQKSLQLIAKLNEIKFKGLNSIKAGTALTNPVVAGLRLPLTFKRVIFKILKLLFFVDFYYEKEYLDFDGLVFYFSHSYCFRKEQLEMLRNVGNVVDSKAFITANPKKRFSVRNIYLIIFFPVWFFQMKGIDFLTRLYLLSEIGKCKQSLSLCEKLFDDKDSYKLFVSFCDFHLADNVATQYLKGFNVKTATLQHGWYMLSKESEALYDVASEGFISDYFLTWGELSAKRLELNGVCPDKIVQLGNPKFIESYINTEEKKDIILLVLTSSEDDGYQENFNLIQICNEVAKKLNKNYMVRFHPGDNAQKRKTLSGLFNEMYIDADLSRDNVLKTGASFKYSVMANSSLFAEFVYLGYNSFIYSSFKDIYEEIDELKFFDAEGLVGLFEKTEDEISYSMMLIKEKLCGVGDIKQNYIDFFKGIVYDM